MIGRFLRTVTRLHPVQVAARPPNAILGRIVRQVPGGAAPRTAREWPEAPEELRALANAERTRGSERLGRLRDPRLREYEACYGLELGADDRGAPADWTSPAAIEPFPASVRARRIAVGIRCGRVGLDDELARAARAVLLRPELHLLGNHLLENGLGLACAGAVARGGEGDLWWHAGSRLLGWQLPAQFLEDGGHVERSASYHVALTAALLEAIELANTSGRGPPALWSTIASGALGWMNAVEAPDGTFPLFNDASVDAAPRLSDVAAFGAALGIAPDPSDLGRTGWLRLETSDACIFLDAGPDAEGWQPGHAHADGLSFELWIGGERAIVDFGVAAYGRGPEREETRATRAHNTVALDGLDSCEVWSAFRVGRRGHGRVRSVETGELPRAEVEHDGYAWLPGAPRHVRTLELRRGLLEIRDRVLGGAERRAWASRLRLDARMASRLRVSGSTPVHRSDDRWHLRHGEALRAAVLEQRAHLGDASGVTWRIEW